MKIALIALSAIFFGCVEPLGTNEMSSVILKPAAPAPNECIVVWMTGQSVQTSGAANPPDPGPFPAGSRWRTTGGGAFIAYDNTTGIKDLALVRRVVGLGRQIIIANTSVGGTTSAEWTPPSGAMWVATQATMITMLAALPAALAGRTPRWIHLHDQGEEDKANVPAINDWAANALSLFSAIDAQVGVNMPHVVTWTKIPQPGATGPNMAALRAQQTLAAQSSLGWPNNIIDRDAYPYGPDNVHLTIPVGRWTYGVAEGDTVNLILAP